MEMAFEEEYGLAKRLFVSELDESRLETLEADYAAWDFRLGNALPFDARLSRRFEWGEVTFELSLRHGIVAHAKVWSDAMDEDMIRCVAPAITGARYENGALAAALRALQSSQADEIAAWIECEELG